MKILLLGPLDETYHTDGLELTLTYGLRSILGENFIDIPRKPVLYHDFSKVKKENLKGKGFTYLREKLPEISPNLRAEAKLHTFDAIIVGTGPDYGEDITLYNIGQYNARSIWRLDGHDLFGNAVRKVIWRGIEVIGTQYPNCFKRELVEEGLDDYNVHPSGFGIPGSAILPLDFTIKDQLIQKTAPAHSLFKTEGQYLNELGLSHHHVFSEESDYYFDMSRSWFGLSCIKGGWDCLRHYEIIAAGAVLLFRDYDLKPPKCSPQKMPCPSYSSPFELSEIISRLLPGGKPTNEYFAILSAQRNWLLEYGTCIARANQLITVIRHNLKIV
jgi:hypothetical protein